MAALAAWGSGLHVHAASITLPMYAREILLDGIRCSLLAEILGSGDPLLVIDRLAMHLFCYYR